LRDLQIQDEPQSQDML
jgi:hypothetical protein